MVTLKNNVEPSINIMSLQEGTMIKPYCLNTINAKNAINTSKHSSDLELFSSPVLHIHVIAISSQLVPPTRSIGPCKVLAILFVFIIYS